MAVRMDISIKASDHVLPSHFSFLYFNISFEVLNYNIS